MFFFFLKDLHQHLMAASCCQETFEHIITLGLELFPFALNAAYMYCIASFVRRILSFEECSYRLLTNTLNYLLLLLEKLHKATEYRK